MPYFKVSLNNVVVKADNIESAINGFCNYANDDSGIDNFKVIEIPRKDLEYIDYYMSKDEGEFKDD